MINQFLAGAVAKAVGKQGKLFRYKDSFTLFLVALVWLAAFALENLTGIPETAAVVIGVIGNFAAMVVTRLTPGAITPSMARRLEEAANDNESKPKHEAPGNWIDDARHALAKG